MASNDVIVRLVADVSSLQSGMDKAQKELESLKSKTEKAGSSISSTFKKIGTIVAGALAVDKIIGFGKECVSLGANVEEMENKFNVVFKQTSASMDKWANDFARAIGRNKTEIKTGVSNLGDLLIGFGMTEQASADLSQKVIALSYDLASFNNVQDTDAIDRMTKGILGEHEGLKALGIVINEATIKTKMLEMGINGQFASLDEVTKANIRYQIMLDQTANAQGDAERSADSYTNKMKNLQATTDTIKETIGKMLLPTLTELADWFTKGAEKVLGFVEKFAELQSETESVADALAGAFDSIGLEWVGDIVRGFQDIIEKVKDVINWFKEHETITLALASAIGVLTAGIIAFNVWLKASAIALKVSAIATGVWNTVAGVGTAITTAFGVAMAFLTSPIGLITLAIAGLVAIGVILWKNWGTICEYATAIWNGIKNVISNVWEGIKTSVSNAVQWVSDKIASAWNFIKELTLSIWEGIKSALLSVWDSIKGYVTPIFEFIATIITAVWQGIMLVSAIVWTAISGIILTVWNCIKTAIETVLNVISTIIETVWNVIKNIISTVLDFIKSYITTAFNFYKTIITTVLDAIKGVITSVWNSIKGVITTILDAIKGVVSNVWNGIKSVISNVVEGIKSMVSTGFTWVKDKVSGIFNSLKSSVMGIWNGIGKGIQGVVNGIIKVINGMVRAMNKISFDVPDWVPGMGGKKFGFNIPTISEVSWFASGGIIKGTKGGTIVGVGEAGDEAILPLSNKGRMKPFAEAVANLMPDNDKETGTGEGAGVSINIEKLSVREEADIEKIAQKLYKLQERNRRKRGVVYA